MTLRSGITRWPRYLAALLLLSLAATACTGPYTFVALAPCDVEDRVGDVSKARFLLIDEGRVKIETKCDFQDGWPDVVVDRAGLPDSQKFIVAVENSRVPPREYIYYGDFCINDIRFEFRASSKVITGWLSSDGKPIDLADMLYTDFADAETCS